MDVVQAVDVWDAVERLSSGEAFCALLVDLELLGDKGFASVVLSRSLESGRSVPVLGLTSAVTPSPELQRRCAATLRLPLQPHQLLAALRRLVPNAPWSLPPEGEAEEPVVAPEDLPDVQSVLRAELERLHAENAALTERVRRKQAQLDALGQVAELIHDGQPARVALSCALAALVKLDDLRFAALFLQDPGAALRCAAQAGWPAHLADDLGVMLARRLSAGLPAETCLMDGDGPAPLPLRRLQVRRAGFAPIAFGGQRCGAVIVGFGDTLDEALALRRLDNARVWLGHAVAFTRSVRRLHRVQARLSQEANHDALTSLLNRRAFAIEAEDKLERLRGVDEPAALLYMDLDCFKQLNDRLGHEAGDEALLIVADTLQASVRRQDLCARLGGDEFAALCIGVSDAYAGEVAASVRAAIRRNLHARFGAHSGLDVSVGVAQLYRDGADLDALLRHADAAMYVVKRRHRRSAQGV